MSTGVEKKVLEMQFNGKNFDTNATHSIGVLGTLQKALNLTGGTKGLESIDAASKKINFTPLSSAVESVKMKFSALEVVAVTALANITNSAVNAGKRTISALTIDPIKSGFKEYETQINAVQTILANTSSKGTTIDQVNMALDELNTYADKTIYNFTEMTRNIGTFTAAGTDLKTATKAIQGIANLAAVSGSTSEQASTAMYQLSQALASGTVKLMDWNSVVNAGMGGEVFQNALKDTARKHGTAVDEMIKSQGSFRESLTEGWLTADVLNETLSKFTTTGANEYLAANSSLTKEAIANIRKEASSFDEAATAIAGKSKLNQKEIKELLELSQVAEDAATKVKTFSQLKDTVKEAVSSGWTQTWETLIGDFEESKTLFTEISNSIGGMVSKSADARNALVAGAMTSSWEKLEQKVTVAGISVTEFKANIIKSAEAHNISIKDMIKKEGSLQETLKSGWLTTEIFTEAMGKSAGTNAELIASMTTELTSADSEMSKLVNTTNVLSGRELLISSLRIALVGVGTVITKIKDAWSEVFPPKTVASVYGVMNAIHMFAESVKLSEEQLQNIKMTFKGLFSILSITKTVIGSIVKAIFPAVDGAGMLGTAVLSVTAKVGAGIVALDEYLKHSKFLSDMVGTISDGITKALNSIKEKTAKIKVIFEAFRTEMSSDFGSPGFEVVHASLERIQTRLGQVGEASDTLANTFKAGTEKMSGALQTSKIYPVLEAIWSSVMRIGVGIGTGISNVIDNISQQISNLNFESLIDFMNGLTFGALTIGIIKFFKSFSSGVSTVSGAFKGIKGAVGGIKGILDGVRGCLTAYQDQIKAGTLMKIAQAVGILALSLIGLALVDSTKLSGAIFAITSLFGELVVSMGVLSKMTSSSMGGTLKAVFLMKAMAVSILILAVALRTLSSLEVSQLTKGVLAIGALMKVMLMATQSMTKGSGKLLKGAGNMILFALAVRVLADACIALSALSFKELVKGLLGVTVLLGVISLFINNTKITKKAISTSIGILILAKALENMAAAVGMIGAMSVKQLIKGLGGITILLGVLDIFLNTTPNAKKVISTAIGLRILASALSKLAEVLITIGAMSIRQIAKGLIGLAGALGIIAIAMRIMPKNMIITAIGLVIVANAVTTLAGALAILGNLSVKQLIKSLGGLGILLLELSIGLHLMQGTLGGSAALLVAAVALGLLVPVLSILGAMSIVSIAKGLLAIAGVFVILGVAGIALTAAIPSIIGVSLALLLVGAAILATGVGLNLMGVGITLVSAGLTALAIAGTATATAAMSSIAIIIVGIAKLIPTIAIAIAEGIIQFCGVLASGAPVIAQAAVAIVLSTVQALVTTIPVVVDGIFTILQCVLDTLVTRTPEIVQAVFSILISALEVILINLPKVIDTAFKIVTTFIDGVAKKIPSVIQSAFNLILSFINGLATAIEKNTPLILKAVGNLALAILKGIGDTLMSGIGALIDIGGHLMEGLVEGIAGAAKKVVNAVTDVAKKAVDGVKNFLGIHSPSTVFRAIGNFMGGGLVLGIADTTKSVDKAAVGIGSSAISSLSKVLSGTGDLFGVDLNMEPTIRPVMDLSNVKSGVKSINTMFSRTRALDASSSIKATTDSKIQNEVSNIPVTSNVEYTFEQNNYSPKALSSLELYRQSKNLFSMTKGLVTT